MFYLWFVICDPNLAGVTISGQTSWKNPGGYLPGMMASYLPFFGCMSIAYMVAGLLWMLQVRGKKHSHTRRSLMSQEAAL
jgi:hypothetical protein